MGKRGNMRGKRDGDMGGEIEKRIREGKERRGHGRGNREEDTGGNRKRRYKYMRGEREEDIEAEAKGDMG